MNPHRGSVNRDRRNQRFTRRIIGAETEKLNRLGKVQTGIHPSTWDTYQPPRNREGTLTSHVSKKRNLITPMRSRVTPSKPPVRSAEVLSGCRKVQEAKASNRKVTGIHNRLDREYPTRKGADVDLVSHPKNDVTVTHQGKS
jgi:hypothetical protein